MVTAKNQSEDVVEALKLGANDYITKPIDFPVTLARIATHITHRRAQEALRESETRYALAAQGTNDGLWDWDLRTEQIYYSPRWKAMLGHAEDEVGTAPEEWLGRVHPDDLPRVRADLAAHRQGLTPHFQNEHRMLHKDKTYHWMLSRGLAVRDASGKGWRMAGSQTDITEGKVADALTGLPNRILFMDRLERAIERAKRNPESRFAVLFLDLDRFKVVNDSLGHLIGDQLLIAIARRLETCLRSTDSVARFGEVSTIARLGGDEFTILLDDIKHPDDASRVADRIQTALAAPFHLDGHEIYTSASIGITLSGTGYDSPEDLLRDADTAMYMRQEPGQGPLRNVRRRHEGSGRGPAANGDRTAPRHPAPGVLPPLPADPVARHRTASAVSRPCSAGSTRERGLIAPDGLYPGCRGDRADHAPRLVGAPRGLPPDEPSGATDFPPTPALLMCVNLSSKQFLQADLPEAIAGLLDETGLDPRHLKLEITESTIMDDHESAAVMLDPAARAGHPGQHRRLRHGPLLLELSPTLPDRYRQDRSLVRQRDGRGRELEFRPGDRDAGP